MNTSYANNEMGKPKIDRTWVMQRRVHVAFVEKVVAVCTTELGLVTLSFVFD